jgi:membrane-bound serine protease (ClpP class)
MPFVLGFFGLLLIFLEFFVPGSILATLGILLLTGSLIWTAFLFSAFIIIFYFVLLIFLTMLTVRFALYKVRQKKVLSEGDLEGVVSSCFDVSLIDKLGIVETNLRPSGYVKIEGKRVQAMSENGFITKGKKVIVVSGCRSYLIVKPM